MALSITAHVVSDPTGWSIQPAPTKREWMDGTPGGFAYHCLPLSVANQAGWAIPCPVNFSAVWNGKPEPGSIAVRFAEDTPRWAPQINSQFGCGILTFAIPWLFRTSQGYGLLVRGATNYQKDNCVALDGLVETDWAPYTFTMNWRIMRRQTEVWFKKGDPICMLMPYPIAALDQFQTAIKPISADPALAADFAQFRNERTAQMEELRRTGSRSTQRHYTRGRMPDGTEVTAHRTKFTLGKFGA